MRERIELLEQQKRSGLSQAAFCRRANIHPVTVSGWRRALGQKVPAFAEVQVRAPEVATSDHGAVLGGAADLHLRNGAKLEVALGGGAADSFVKCLFEATERFGWRAATSRSITSGSQTFRFDP